MEIIKHEDPEKIKFIKQHWSSEHTCSHCGCVFTVRDGEVKPRTQYNAGYATCPDCGMKVK